MRTSATGADRRLSRAGFTLVELMVVVVIVGLVSSVVMLTAPVGGRSLIAEADRFGARLVRAKEEALLTNRAVGVEVTAEGYAFRARTARGWERLEDGPFKPVAWGEGVAAVADQGQGRALARFESTGQAEPLTVTLTRAAQAVQVSVDAAGNVRVHGPA